VPPSDQLHSNNAVAPRQNDVYLCRVVSVSAVMPTRWGASPGLPGG